MSRSRLFANITRLMRVAHWAEAHKLSTKSALERVAEIERESRREDIGRREFLRGVASMAAAVAVPSGKVTSGPRIAIVGGGLAGLVCADTLRRKGLSAVVYEANNRFAGRVFSTRRFPGQVAELGGELIDNLHKTMLGYAREFGLAREDVNKAPGETFYYFDNQRYSEEEVVEEYRELVGRMRPDLQTLGEPTFFQYSEADAALDHTDLATYLDSRAEGLPLIRAVLDVAYNIEFGLEIHEQSCLNLLLFIHLDKRSKFTPFGVFSDERFHLVDGNDRIAAGIAERLPGPLETGAFLTRLGLGGDGKYRLWFNGGSSPEIADAVVLTVPFSVLRDVQLDDSLGLSADKRRAIAHLTYGANAKTMIGFNGRPWTLHGCKGTVYADLPNVQSTWETNWTAAGTTSILTDYAGGDRGRTLQQGTDESAIQQQADSFLLDIEGVLPGIRDAATHANGKYVVERGAWLFQKFSKGSYTCNGPGYFTTIAGLEGQSAGLLKVAGEHTNSFYEWQGFMEGACLSGIDAANELLEDIRRGRL